jgi:hypothetical protein
VLVWLGEFEIVEQGLASFEHRSESRRFSVRVKLVANIPGYVELGHVAVHGDYFSRRLMMKRAGSPPNSYGNMFTISGTAVNVTRLCGVLVEMYQLPSGKIDFDAINSVLK